VVSTTLDEPLEWSNSTLIKGKVVDEVSKLKQQPGRDILIFGSGKLVHTLMHHEVVDEYRLVVYPVLLGNGKRLFGDGTGATLKLAETRAFGSGVVLEYQTDR
jgi:dihydrofolate reductase